MEEVLDGCKKKVNEALKKKFSIELDGNKITFPVDIKECNTFRCLSSVMEDEDFKRIYKFYHILDSFKF